MNDAIERAQSFARSIRETLLMVNMFKGGKTPLLPASLLEQMGYRIAIFPSDTQRVAIYASKEVMAVLKRDGSPAAIDDRLTTFQERDVSVGLGEWEKREERYLKDRGEKK